ncbi:unnamed protein product (macronuclear) [Paramecium tetraurelia]|uniref:EamA domain-containing protein n=1 Tax=Paramecium tetraurelia TaxID=5888 RepID=A0CQ51_PARTE|nr:uncharacterized protein GSPATT00009266001 [Paramecium tetraurelia]CAK72918.1 unnamed protein product [Paramecium tetraurelia]|eukprot:XP_001440315.1 hypothetical protein (macronuclear) [Paramecium tetraurelia strain d4-2]
MEYIVTQIEYFTKYLESKWIRSAPIFYVMTGILLSSINSLLSKTLGMNANQIVFGRGIIVCIIGKLVTQQQNINLYGFDAGIYQKLLLRSLIGCFATLLFYTGLFYVNISEAQVLMQTTSFWTTILGIYILKTEQFSWRLVLNFLFCFMGIILLVQPPFLRKLAGEYEIADEKQNQFLGCLILLLSSMLFSLVQVLIKNLSHNVNQLVIPQYFSITSIIFSSFLATCNPDMIWRVPSVGDLIKLCLIGIVSYLQQLLMNRAYMKGNLTEMAMLGQTQLIYGYLFDILRGAHISFLSICGSILIASSICKRILEKNKVQDQLSK